jgi:hypothetical protein
MRTIHHRPIRSGLIFLVLISLQANACRLLSPGLATPTLPALAASPSNLVQPASTKVPNSTTPPTTSSTTPPTASPTPIPSSPQPQTETPDLRIELRQELAVLVAKPEWVDLGLSDEHRAAWEEFAAGTADLSEDELIALRSFLQRWQVLSELAKKPVPWNAKVSLHVNEIPDAQGSSKPMLYAVQKDADPKSKQNQLFLIAHDKKGGPTALVLAPIIEGLSQRPGAEGEYVEYVLETGEWLLRADARPLDKNLPTQEALIEMLKENDSAKEYQQASVYPRFYFNIPEIASAFYLIEKLTLNQLKLLISVFDTFNQEKFAALKPFIFPPGEEVAYLVSREPHALAAALALPMGGTPPQGIILLYSKNVFSSKYETASGLAHEAVHISQGTPPGCDDPQGRLKREIGDGTIPDDFYDWSAEQIIQAARNGQIGAYHMSLWMSLRLGVDNLVRFYTSIIKTGTVNGISIINCP